MEDWRVIERAADMARRGEACALATVVWRQGPSSGKQGSRAVITASGAVHGWIGGACAEPAVLREARQVIADGTARLLLLGPAGSFGDAVPDGLTVVPISCQSDGALEIYIEPVVPAPHLVIVGRSPMAHTLAELAGVLGWRAELHDGAEFAAPDADERSLVVVATQGHGDEEAVKQAVAARPAYLGLVGSHRRGAAVLGYLADRGVPRDQLDRVRVPVGLDLGPTSHREIAVAILAELVQLRAAGALSPATTDSSSSNGTALLPQRHQRYGAAVAGPATAGAAGGAGAGEAVDPVCGMTASSDRAGHPLRHGGRSYYFCSVGCRQRFESDPAAYIEKETRC